MSSSIRPDDFSKYAPRWVREGTAKPRDAVALPPAPQLERAHSAEPVWHRPSPFEGDVRHWRKRGSPDQQVPPEAPVFVSGPVQLGIVEKVFRTAAVVSFGVIAMGALGLVLFPDAPKEASKGQSVVAAAEAPAATVSQREKYPVKSASRVGVPDPQPVMPKPVHVETIKAADAAPAPEPVVPPAPQTANAVYVVASADASVPAPPRQQLQAPQSVAAPSVQPSQSPLPTVQSQAPPMQQPRAQPADTAQSVASLAPQRVRSERILSPDELGRLINRGEAFLAQGDVSAARLVLLRAAEARDPRAALALGSTFDPNVLKRMGVVGVQADPDQARAWYERAAEFGSGDANQRLSALAQR
jgi:hypothetical protein